MDDDFWEAVVEADADELEAWADALLDCAENADFSRHDRQIAERKLAFVRSEIKRRVRQSAGAML